MKMPAMNFDFGPFTESGVVALSPYGIAVRSSKGEYLTYNAVTGATIDVTGFTFDFQKMPAAIKDLRAGDMVLHRGKPMYVQSVEEDGIHCIDILNSEAKVIVPVTNMFGFNFVTKVVSLMNFNAAQPSAENPFGNLMPFMMMSSVMGDVSDSDRQYIFAKDDITKISKLYGSRFIIITSKTAPAITLEYKDAKSAEAAYEDLMLQLCNLHT